jgi:uncharacterized membrane protein YqhA
MSTLDELKKSIIADGIIDDARVKRLREMVYADGQIEKEGADFLFELNSIRNTKTTEAWKAFFIEAITSFLLEDDESPGEIDDNEAQWLRAKIQYDGRLGKIERALLANLKKKSIRFPELLHYKNKSVLYFEAILFGTRFITFLAVLGSMVAAIALFINSSMQVISGLHFFIEHFGSGEGKDVEHLMAMLVSSVDGYLFATVLLIFSMGIYELFINKIDVVSKEKDSRPNWLVITSIDDLKSSLGKVILMILIVSFFEHSLTIEFKTVYDLLFLGIGILLISVALFLTHAHAKSHKKEA